MRILFQYYKGGGGGLANIILLLKALARQYPQDHIDIVCLKSSELCSLSELPNVEILPYGGRKGQEIERLFLGFGGLNRIAKERQADIIWSLNLGSYVRASVPQVLSILNLYQVCSWSDVSYHPQNRFHVAVLRWFFRRSLRVSDGVIVETPIMSEYVKKTPGAPKLIEIAPKAVENTDDVTNEHLPLNIRQKLENSLGKQPFTFLYVGTYFPHKNHITLIRAFDILAGEGINTRAVFTLGTDELITCGGEKARKLIESGYLVPVGWIEKPYLRALYEACDACLMPSVLESLSSAHLEAMQWSKPQIVSDLRYARDLCGEAAVYANAENHVDWAQKIVKFISDENLRKSLVNAGRERMKLYPQTWAEVAAKVHSFLEKVLINPIK